MSLTIDDFNNEFIVTVSNIMIPGVSGHLGTMEYIVTCKTNNLFYFKQHHCDNATFLSTATSASFFQAAFKLDTLEIQGWANSVRYSPSVFSDYVPKDVPILGVTTFNQNFHVHVRRYEAYPADNPNIVVVNFNVQTGTTGDTFFVESTIPIGTTNNLILDTAWDNVKDCIGTQASSLVSADPVIGSIVVPTSF